MGWKSFLIYYLKYLFLGTGILLILFTLFNTGLNGTFQRGPQQISAQEGDPSDSYFIPDPPPEAEPLPQEQPVSDSYFTPEPEQPLQETSDTYFAPEPIAAPFTNISDTYFAPDNGQIEYENPSDTYFAPDVTYENPSDTYFAPQTPLFTSSDQRDISPPLYTQPSQSTFVYETPRSVSYPQPSVMPFPSVVPQREPNIYNRQPQNITINNNPRSSSTSQSSSRSIVNITNPAPSPSPVNRFSLNCSVTPIMVVVGDQVTWRSSVIGGSGNFTYDWFGNDLIENQNAPAFTVIYQSPGIRSGSLTVTDNRTGVSSTQNCGSVNVIPLSTSSPASVLRQSSVTEPDVFISQNQASCPPGTIFSHSSPDTIFCAPDNTDINIQQSAVQTVSAAQPVSATASPLVQSPAQSQTTPTQVVITQSEPSQIKELPKTGLPLLGVGAGLLIPLGIRLLKLGANKKFNASVANSLWVDKQLKF